MPFSKLFNFFSLPGTRELKLQKLLRLIDITVLAIEIVESDVEIARTYKNLLKELHQQVQAAITTPTRIFHAPREHHSQYVNLQQAIMEKYQSKSNEVEAFFSTFETLWAGNNLPSGSNEINASVRRSVQVAVVEVFERPQSESVLGEDATLLHEIIDRSVPPSPQAQDGFSPGSTQDRSRKYRVLHRQQDRAGTSGMSDSGEGRFLGDSARESGSSSVPISPDSARFMIGSTHNEPSTDSRRGSIPDVRYMSGPASLKSLEESRAQTLGYIGETATPEGDNSASALISHRHRLFLDRPQDQAGTSNSNSLGGRFSVESARDSYDSSHVLDSKDSARCTIGPVQYDDPDRRSTPDFIYNRPASLEWLEKARAHLGQTATPEGDNSASASASARDSV